MHGGLVLLLAATVLLAACDGCTGQSPGTKAGVDGPAIAAGVSAAQACQDMAAAACARLAACTPFGLKVAYGDQMTCTQRSALACAPMIGAPGATVTSAQIEQCAQATLAETCPEWLDNAQPSACTFTGMLAAGASCGAGAQCQSGYCRLAPLSVCGACVARAGAGPGPDGGPVCAVDADCAATLVCAAGGSCVSPGAAGAACGPAQPCSRTLACIGGKCAAPVPVGSACTALTDCDGTKGGICNTNNKVCIQTATAPDGQPCGIVNGGITTCTDGSTCANVSKLGVGTCHQPPADGAPCGLDLACMGPAICTSAAKCTLPAPGSCH